MMIGLFDDEFNPEIKPETFGPKLKEAHVIFAIDFSGSMKKSDVKKDNRYIKRWDATFECVKFFIQDQIDWKNRIANDNAVGDVVVSLLIFNLEARIILNRMPLLGDGSKVLQALNTARKKHEPHLGTSFTAGFEKAKELAANGVTEGDQNVVLVFLTDGKPGDLQSKPPQTANEPMQTLVAAVDVAAALSRTKFRTNKLQKKKKREPVQADIRLGKLPKKKNSSSWCTY